MWFIHFTMIKFGDTHVIGGCLIGGFYLQCVLFFLPISRKHLFLGISKGDNDKYE